MELEFHRLVASDVSRIMQYYEEEVGQSDLAVDFYAELRAFFAKAAEAPESYSVREGDIRRVNLERFPYHFLFRIVSGRIRVLVVRHHGRDPALGRSRR